MYSIEKNSKLTYIIQVNNTSPTIIKSIQSLSFLNTKIKYQEIEIYTNDIQPIKPTQNHEMIYKLIQCLCEQQEHLQSIGYSFYTFYLEDIIMTDNNFFCLNDRNICKITNENTFSQNRIEEIYDDEICNEDKCSITTLDRELEEELKDLELDTKVIDIATNISNNEDVIIENNVSEINEDEI